MRILFEEEITYSVNKCNRWWKVKSQLGFEPMQSLWHTVPVLLYKLYKKRDITNALGRNGTLQELVLGQYIFFSFATHSGWVLRLFGTYYIWWCPIFLLFTVLLITTGSYSKLVITILTLSLPYDICVI